MEIKISYYIFGRVWRDLSCVNSTGGLFGPLLDNHVCVDEWDQSVRGRQAVRGLQHHREPPVSAQTQRRGDSTAAGSNAERTLHKTTALRVPLNASGNCVQAENLPNPWCLYMIMIVSLNAKTRHIKRGNCGSRASYVLMSCATLFSFLLQLEISNLERTRSVMAEELVRLTSQNDEMEEKVKEIPKLKIQLKVSCISRNGYLNWLNEYLNWMKKFFLAISAGDHMFCRDWKFCVRLCISGSGAETQHHPADVWREGRRGRGAETWPGRREEHVQNPDRWTAAKPEVNSCCCTVLPLGHTQTNELHTWNTFSGRNRQWGKPNLISGSRE